MLRLDELVSLRARPGVEHVIAAQCPFGSRTQKRTSWITFNVTFSGLPERCTHAMRKWFKEVTAEVLYARHVPSKGCVRYYTTKEEALRSIPSEQDNYVSTALATYPPLLNRYIAACLRKAVDTRISACPPADPPLHHWADRLGRDQVQFRQHLRGMPRTSLKDESDRQAIGGLRNASQSLDRLSSVAAFGRSVGLKIQLVLMENSIACTRAGRVANSWINTTCALVGNQSESTADPAAVHAIRSILEDLCDFQPPAGGSSTDCTTSINVDLLEAWRRKAKDPDAAVTKWLKEGAPAGITQVPEPCGIFPCLDDVAGLSPEQLSCDIESFQNYPGVDGDDDAIEDIVEHIAKGHLKAFASVEELRNFLGSEPILNKIGIITKERAGIVKKRMTLDTKVAGTKECSAKHERVLLPRLLDAIMQAMVLLD